MAQTILASMNIPVAVGSATGQNLTGPGFLELAAPKPFGQDRTLVLGDRALDLQQELIVGVLGDRMVQKDHRTASAPEFFEQQDLVGELAGKAVGTEHGNGRDRAIADRVAQAVKAWSIQARAAEPLVPEDMVLVDLVAAGCGPGLQRGQLAVDGLIASLAFG
jgi:hypothetical protein